MKPVAAFVSPVCVCHVPVVRYYLLASARLSSGSLNRLRRYTRLGERRTGGRFIYTIYIDDEPRQSRRVQRLPVYLHAPWLNDMMV